MTQATDDNAGAISDELRRDLALVLPAVKQAKEPGIKAYCRGEAVGIAQATAQAKKLIHAGAAPAMVGLNGLTIEAVREAVALAERCRARLLPAPLAEPLSMRMNVVQAATLGHVFSADLRVAFRDDPSRHDCPLDEAIASRVPNTLFVDGGDLSALRKLRAMARGQGAAAVTSTTALPVKQVAVTLPAGTDPRIESQWHHLAADLQRSLRVSVVTLPDLKRAGNIRGALEVITWQTGLSCATGGVDFGDGGPRPCGGAATLLPRGAVDVIIDTGLIAFDSGMMSGVKHRVRIGDALDASAEVCFVTPGLAAGLRARVMRFDGAILWLCDDPSPAGGAMRDPVVELLSKLAGN
jgi:hypothetical protein